MMAGRGGRRGRSTEFGAARIFRKSTQSRQNASTIAAQRMREERRRPTMQTAPDSTIAALFYAIPPALNFARLVGDLDGALSNLPHTRRSLSWDCDDVAIFDIDGSRIVLALAERLPGACKTCLSIAVGPNARGAEQDRFADRRAAVAALIVERICQRLPADEIIWHGATGVLDAEALDAATDRLLEAREAEAAARRAEADAAVAAADETTGTAADRQWPSSFERLMARVERELAGAAQPGPAQAAGEIPAAAHPTAAPATAPAAAETEATAPAPATPAEVEAAATASAAAAAMPRAAIRPNRRAAAGLRARNRARAVAAASLAVANDLPQVPGPALQEAMRIRMALYPPAEAEADAQASVPARLAVGAMGTTLVLVAAPVGAALLTYNVLRGADLRLTARAIALTGAAFGIGNLPAIQSLLAFV
jgi:hypothetical protein